MRILIMQTIRFVFSAYVIHENCTKFVCSVVQDEGDQHEPAHNQSKSPHGILNKTISPKRFSSESLILG